MCQGRGEVQSVQRSFLGQVMTSRPCPQCQGFGTLIPHPCPECSGEGRVRTRRTITVKIPPGVDTGTRIQLTGEGEVGPGGGPAGDLFLEVVETPHDVFTRQGDDLHCTVDAADDGRRARHHGRARDPRRRSRRSTSSRARSPARSSRCGRRASRTCAPAVAATCTCTSTSLTPTKLDARQEELLRELAALRGEEQPDRAPCRPATRPQGGAVLPAARRLQPDG